MAEIRFTIGNLEASRTASDSNALPVVQSFLQNLCEEQGIDYDALTNQQGLNLAVKELVRYMKEGADMWNYKDAVRQAVENTKVDPVIFE